MGFLSNLLGAATQLLPGPLAAIAQTVGGAFGVLPSTQAQRSIQTQGPQNIPLRRQVGLSPTGAARLAAGLSPVDPRRTGGNGRVFKQTIIQTIDVSSGDVLREVIKEGAPFLMNKEVAQLRVVAKKLTKAERKLPRKTRSASPQKELIDAVTAEALRNVITGHGHHGNIVHST